MGRIPKTMASEPLVSVCIPSYNNEEFIAQTLESVLDQSFSDFELIVVDDCSTDRTVSIIKGFSDPRIRFSQNPRNLGLIGNWNKTLSCARGKYVKLLCGDDLLELDCLARQAPVLEDTSNRDVVLAICNRTVINSPGEVVFRRKCPFHDGRITGRELFQKSVRRGSNLIGEPAVGLFRNGILDQTTPCQPANSYTIDLELLAELLKHGDAFVDHTSLASFRISAKANGTRLGFRQAACFRAFIRNLRRGRHYHMSLLDTFSGCLFSLLWCVLRNALIRMHARKPSRPLNAHFPSGCSEALQAARIGNFRCDEGEN
jgi:glycosyltransferase involved in cell wall biosynthesis